MKNSKKGISLIVLVITIIVIIILAAAVILTLTNNNPIDQANQARYSSDRANMQAVLTNTIAKIMAEHQATVSIVTDGTISSNQIQYTLNNPSNAANATGTITFGTGKDTPTAYFTGKALPVYAAGTTVWTINKDDGLLKLKVGSIVVN